jgi:hypothetical protein
VASLEASLFIGIKKSVPRYESGGAEKKKKNRRHPQERLRVNEH